MILELAHPELLLLMLLLGTLWILLPMWRPRIARQRPVATTLLWHRAIPEPRSKRPLMPLLLTLALIFILGCAGEPTETPAAPAETPEAPAAAPATEAPPAPEAPAEAPAPEVDPTEQPTTEPAPEPEPPSPSAASDGPQAAGGPCLAASDCQSGVCEGEGCGPDQPGVCAPEQRACTRDRRPFCGCDGQEFFGSSTCPGNRFQHKGPC